MAIKEDDCIHCGKCTSLCPGNNLPQLFEPQHAYAAWSSNVENHRLSASGGIAYELYSFAIQNGMYVCGAVMNSEFEVHYQISKSLEDISGFRSSKYTFSYLDDIAFRVKSLLREKEKVLFIGLPCHVAAIRNNLSLDEQDNLFIADIVCHGLPGPDFFKQHSNFVETKNKTTLGVCSFRDPQYGTENYHLTYYDQNNELVWDKQVYEDDLYQIGYHEALIYRDCCYECQYACRNRTGDLTLCDYNGLGTLSEYSGERKEVSCVLVNTTKGQLLFDELLHNCRIVATERPIDEPINNEIQLRHPSVAPKEREIFVTLLKKNNCNFEEAAKIAFHPFVDRNMNRIKQKKKIAFKNAVSSRIPTGIKNVLRRLRK